MKTEEITKKVDEVLINQFGTDRFNAKDDLIDDFGCDSIDCVEIIMELEKVFEITIKDADAEKCETVQDIYDLIKNTLK